MKHSLMAFLAICLLIITLSSCSSDVNFQNNPHGPGYIAGLPVLSKSPEVPPAQKALPTNSHLSRFGFGASLAALAEQFGPPTVYSDPPNYAFKANKDNTQKWPGLSLIVVTMRDNHAVEFSYVPGATSALTYQAAQDFAVTLLPDDAQGPITIQKEDDHAGKCLAKTYHSDILKTIFPKNDFMSVDGKDSDIGNVTVNFFPDASMDGGFRYTSSFNNNILGGSRK